MKRILKLIVWVMLLGLPVVMTSCDLGFFDNPVSPDLKVLKPSITVQVGKSYRCNVHASTKAKLTFTSADPSIATVDSYGVVTGVKTGKTTIAVKTSGVDDFYNSIFYVETATIDVEVIKLDVPVKSVKLDKTTLTATLGDDPVKLVATVNPDNADFKTVEWTTSDETVVEVEDGVVTFVGAGTATITATATNGTTDAADDKTATCTVTVNKAAASVTTAPTATTGTIGDKSTTALVTAGVADGGTMMYAVTNDNTKPTTTDGFSATVPTAKELTAGNYYVWYYVKADDTHTDSEIAGSVAVTVTEVYTANDYKEGNWNVTDKKVDFTKKTATVDPTVINNSYTGNISSGWYTVTGDNASISGNQNIIGDVHLILCDGAKLTINGQLKCSSGSLYIYGQSEGDGKLNISTGSGNAIDNYDNAGIIIEIHGGEITAESYGFNGIDYDGGINVYCGKLTAKGTSGIHFSEKNFNVYGGEVDAISNLTNDDGGCGIDCFYAYATLVVYGGKVKATGNGENGGMLGYGSGFYCRVQSGTSDIKFYYSGNGTDWDAGTSYSNREFTHNDKRYAKAE